MHTDFADSADSAADLCGIFGGTFDPVHYGHLAPVRKAAQTAGLSQVVYIPAAAPPHRDPPEADAAHRLAMVRIALAAEQQEAQSARQSRRSRKARKSPAPATAAPPARFSADDVELKRPGPSYTIDTLQYLRQQNPNRRYALIIGLDALLQLPKWHRWEELQFSVHIIALTRPGWRMPMQLPRWWHDAQVESTAALHRTAAGKILLAVTTPVDVSGTMVRGRIRAGQPVDGLVPPGVRDYIREHGLYGG